MNYFVFCEDVEGIFLSHEHYIELEEGLFYLSHFASNLVFFVIEEAS